MTPAMLGLTHDAADVALRERLAIPEARVEHTLQSLRETYPACEFVLLSTCNRTELYVASAKSHPDADALRDIFTRWAGGAADIRDAIDDSSVYREGEHAVAHLFRVCGGIESMVLGEPQVLGQVKRAYAAAAGCGAAGPVLHRVFQRAIEAGRRVRRETGVSRGRASVGSVAVQFANGVFDGLHHKTVLAVGAGELMKTVLTPLLAGRPGRLLLVNRTAQRADDLARGLGLTPAVAERRGWDALDDSLAEADVLITATGASEPILSRDRLKRAQRARGHRPLVIVDVAVPRDVEPAAGGLRNVYLYDIDDLRAVAGRGVQGRAEEVERCRVMLDDAAAACHASLRRREAAPLIRALRERMHELGRVELERTLKKLHARHHGAGDYDPAAAEALLEDHTRRLTNKLLHLPLSRFDTDDVDAPLTYYAEALRALFDLPEGVATDEHR